MRLQEQDPDIYRIFAAERRRQREGVELIPSENYVSEAVLEAMGTIFTNKYSEGYPGRRYYGGNENVDEVERLAQERARRLFGVPHANVQPYSGSPANLAVYLATCQPGDPIMGQNLPDGGHLTHGWKVSVTGTYYRSIPYHVKADGYIDIDEVRSLAREHRPKLLWCGATAYVREFPFEQLAAIADETGAFFATDIAHIAGLVIAGAHKSPVPFAHIMTTTTHKTLRGPRGAMILVTEKGLAKDPELAERVDRAVFPGLQGGPHDHTTAAIAVALGEALQPSFVAYGRQVVANAKALAQGLLRYGLRLVTGGTDNHMILGQAGVSSCRRPSTGWASPSTRTRFLASLPRRSIRPGSGWAPRPRRRAGCASRRCPRSRNGSRRWAKPSRSSGCRRDARSAPRRCVRSAGRSRKIERWRRCGGMCGSSA